MQSVRQIQTPIGTLTATAAGGAVTALTLGARAETGPATPVLAELRAQLVAYFDGKLRAFDIPMMPAGTPFQKLVWWALCDVGYGQTCTYGDIAAKLGKDAGASRAIGGANGKNPIIILIPCHRVVAAGGKLGGYSAGGASVKRRLLDLESTDLFSH